MITLRDLNDLLTYHPYSSHEMGDLGEFEKLLRKCAEDFLANPSQEKSILMEIESSDYLIEPTKTGMQNMLERIKIEAKAIKRRGW